jgi:predicted SprT family Zn-dependent metalloprotease
MNTNTEIARAALVRTDFTPFLHEARAVAQLTFDQLGVPHLIDTVNFELNNRLLKVAADARVHPVTKKARIRLGTKYLVLADEQSRIETFVHEAVHVADSHLNPDTWRKGTGHNKSWFDLMSKVGYPDASPSHYIDMNVFRTYYKYKCPCGKDITLTKNRLTRIRNRTNFYLCPQCNTLINA